MVLLGLDVVLRRIRLFLAQNVNLVFLLEPEVDEAHGLGPQAEAPARPPASHLGVAFAYPAEELDVAGEARDVDFAQALAEAAGVCADLEISRHEDARGRVAVRCG